ncbi:hypothetical protein MRB53_037452 [Persea americana]|nr:hypothetical protein MRB53_037452 [Persea americana]
MQQRAQQPAVVQVINHISIQGPVNFSRPRPVDFSPAHKVHHDRSDSSSSIPSNSNDIKRSHSTGGYDSYKEVTALPTQSDFAFGKLEYETPTDTKADFDWDASLEGMRPAQRAMEYLSQRAPVEVRLPSRPQSQQSQSHVRIPSGEPPVELAGSEPQANQGAEVELAGSEPDVNSRPKHTRNASASSSSWDGEDTRSHHTASDVDEQEKKPWKSSNYDVSNLTEAELKKLKKKGINPALYAEMKAARKGKGSWINPLAGNTYLS